MPLDLLFPSALIPFLQSSLWAELRSHPFQLELRVPLLELLGMLVELLIQQLVFSVSLSYPPYWNISSLSVKLLAVTSLHATWHECGVMDLGL